MRCQRGPFVSHRVFILVIKRLQKKLSEIGSFVSGQTRGSDL
ncbi:hypothetical protein FRUB_03980 [Fimbriiglobus ruber]|uniref:Uncharacterized protein n=1 Tax=Fimbriiglobus ruber TaxID=1908690 RepID=A0A225DKH9_9BACT|nr:hypothetical protein FRUB_03980 [Fimbriiglobus ruber]